VHEPNRTAVPTRAGRACEVGVGHGGILLLMLRAPTALVVAALRELAAWRDDIV
jgi:hypothetical protein